MERLGECGVLEFSGKGFLEGRNDLLGQKLRDEVR